MQVYPGEYDRHICASHVPSHVVYTFEAWGGNSSVQFTQHTHGIPSKVKDNEKTSAGLYKGLAHREVLNSQDGVLILSKFDVLKTH